MRLDLNWTVLVLVALFAWMSLAPVHAAATTPAAAVRLVIHLAAAPQPAVGFGRLSRADQQAVDARVRFSL